MVSRIFEMLCFVQDGKELLAEEILAIIEKPADCLHALFDLALKIGGDRILASLTTLAVDGMTKLLEVLVFGIMGICSMCVSLQDSGTSPILVTTVSIAIQMAPHYVSNFTMLKDSLKELANVCCDFSGSQSITKVHRSLWVTCTAHLASSRLALAM